MMPRRTYLDTEFTALNRYTYKLISLALVVPMAQSSMSS